MAWKNYEIMAECSHETISETLTVRARNSDEAWEKANQILQNKGYQHVDILNWEEI